jgi:hypothetical protein
MTERELEETIGAAAFEACTALSQAMDAHVQLSRIKEGLAKALDDTVLDSEARRRMARLHGTLERVHGLLSRAVVFMPDEVWMEFVGRASGGSIARGDAENAESDEETIWGDVPRLACAAGG